MTLGDKFVDLGFRIGMATSGYVAHARLLRAAANPSAAQARTLQRILKRLAATTFGKSLGLKGMRTVAEFRALAPIHEYEELRSWIGRQIAGESRAIVPTQPVMYARTSGTTGEPKLIPVTAEILHGLRRAQRAMSYAQHRSANAFAGKVLAIGGALREVTLVDGTAAGATTGLIYETMPQLMRAKYVVPSEVFAIGDAELKYATIVRLALQHSDISVIATANPSTIVRLLEIVREVLPEMIVELASGAFAGASRLPAGLAEIVQASLSPAPERAARLTDVLRRNQPLTLADLWPGLRAVVTWTQGSCALAANVVAGLLPANARLVEAGYVASEMRGTVVVDVPSGLGLPLIEDVFFEFAPVEAWDRGVTETLLLNQLQTGSEYQIFVTTAAGLVRYRMNDVVRATAPIRMTPTLAFVRKGRGVTNITGEKLAEDQVAAALQRVATDLSLAIPFYIVLADDQQADYAANLQIGGDGIDRHALAASLDSALCALNIEYAAKRKSGRLRPLRVSLLAPAAAVAYRRHLVAKGQREAQLKVQTLQRIQDCDFDFGSFVLDAPRAA